MKNRIKHYLFLIVLLMSFPTIGWAQNQFRNIAALKFHYYSDKRYGVVWEEVFITPMPKSLFLVTALTGENTSYSNINGGRLGIAFDLPGYFYGEAAYSLERNWDTEQLLNTAFLSTTYESGPAMASVSLTGEFSDSSNGVIISPGLKYYIIPDLSANTKLFIAFHDYINAENFFNFAFLGTLEYKLGPEIFTSIGSTIGTEYDPYYEYGKWSIIGGIRVTPTSNISILSQFEYTNSTDHPTNPHEIYAINFVTDIKFGSKKK